MLCFLKGSRKLLKSSEPICLVVGNESCDLDSAMSALSLAFYYQQNPPTSLTDKRNFLPILNIPRRDFPLKTEVSYFLKKHQITSDSLTFRDELQPQLLATSDFILVDHHVSPFVERCIEVYDHRPRDAGSSALPSSCQLTLEQVGSCSTLIADRILHGANVDKFRDVLELLYAAIVMDTVNFSEDAARATEKDHRVAEEIERLLKIDDDRISIRLQLFRELCAAREDISALSAHQLLYKDMKLIANRDASMRIAMPGYPISVQEFLLKPNAAEAVQECAREVDCALVVLLGMKVQEDGSVRRDIGIVNINNQLLCDEVLRNLLAASEFRLRQIENCVFLDGKFYQQDNIKVTRKHILPVVKRVLDEWK